jgi:hypothetical protein
MSRAQHVAGTAAEKADVAAHDMAVIHQENADAESALALAASALAPAASAAAGCSTYPPPPTSMDSLDFLPPLLPREEKTERFDEFLSYGNESKNGPPDRWPFASVADALRQGEELHRPLSALQQEIRQTPMIGRMNNKALTQVFTLLESQAQIIVTASQKEEARRAAAGGAHGSVALVVELITDGPSQESMMHYCRDKTGDFWRTLNRCLQATHSNTPDSINLIGNIGLEAFVGGVGVSAPDRLRNVVQLLKATNGNTPDSINLIGQIGLEAFVGGVGISAPVRLRNVVQLLQATHSNSPHALPLVQKWLAHRNGGIALDDIIRLLKATHKDTAGGCAVVRVWFELWGYEHVGLDVMVDFLSVATLNNKNTELIKVILVDWLPPFPKGKVPDRNTRIALANLLQLPLGRLPDVLGRNRVTALDNEELKHKVYNMNVEQAARLMFFVLRGLEPSKWRANRYVLSDGSRRWQFKDEAENVFEGLAAVANTLAVRTVEDEDEDEEE